MKRTALAGLAALGVGFASAHAAVITSTFDTNTEGFTLSGGSLTHVPTGGNPDGALQAVDTLSNNQMMLTLPSKFIRPLVLGDQLKFDARETVNPNDNFGSFGEVTITGNGKSRTRDFFSGDLPDAWTSVVIDFTASAWGIVSQSGEDDFADLLGNLESIVINIESGSRRSETVLIDNVMLTTAGEIPVPAAAILFAPFACAALWRRRKTA